MKKSLLLTAASLFAVSAMAVNQDAPKAIFNAADVQLGDVKVVKPQIKKDAVKFNATSESKILENSKIRVASAVKAASGVSAEGEALFGIPEGSFFVGCSNAGSYLPGAVLSPAYTDIVWPNMTSDWATQFSWEYGAEESGLVESPTYEYSTEKDLALSLGTLDLRISPKLTASNGSQSDTYYLADETRKQMGVEQGQDIGAGVHFVGGGFSSLWSQLFQANYGISPYDPDHGMALYTIDEAGQTYLMGTGMPYTMLINLFSAPAAPYGIGPDGIWVQGMFGASEDENAEITLTIYKAERTEVTLEAQDGTAMNFPGVELGDKIASCTKTLADFKDYMELHNGSYYGVLTFDAFVAEDEFGYEADVTPVIDSEIAIVITGFDKLSKFALYSNEQAATEAELPLYPTMAFWGVENWNGLGAALYENMSMAASIDANFSYIKTASNSVTVPVEGGTADLDLTDPYLSPNLSHTCVVDGKTVTFSDEAVAELADWLTLTLMIYTDESGQEITGYFLRFEADALPADMTGRSLTFTLRDVYGGAVDLTVQQGLAGVAGVEVSANKVNVVNGNFEVEAANATSVDVYNVAGQKVATAAIEGATTIPAQDLAKGLYILKFNDNTAVKVMK